LIIKSPCTKFAAAFFSAFEEFLKIYVDTNGIIKEPTGGRNA